MLVLLLNAYASKENRLFWFDKEYLEKPERGDSPAIDIGTITRLDSGTVVGSKTYGNDESFFSLEAKRLCNLGKKRSKEYLIGRFENDKYVSTGGVERFKQQIHGRNLKYGAIIGYVQKHDFTHWYDVINSWIDQLIAKRLPSPVHWTLNDKLKKDCIKACTARFTSENSRQSDDIRLFHLWVSLSSK